MRIVGTGKSCWSKIPANRNHDLMSKDKKLSKNNLLFHQITPLDPFGTLIRVRDYIKEMGEGEFNHKPVGSICSCIGDSYSLDMPPHAFCEEAEALLDVLNLPYRCFARDACGWTYAVNIDGKAFSNFATSPGGGAIDVLSDTVEAIIGTERISFGQVESRLQALEAECGSITSILEASSSERLAVEKFLHQRLKEITGQTTLIGKSFLTESSLHYSVRISDKRFS